MAISINLDTVVLTVSNPESPSRPMLVLDTVGLALTINSIAAPGPAVQRLDTVVLTLTLNGFEATELSVCEAKNVIKSLRRGGWARETPGHFVPSDFMNIVNSLRAAESLPTISYTEDCQMSDLLHSLTLGNPPPFVVPTDIDEWFGGEDLDVEPIPIPVIEDLILFIGYNTWKIFHSTDMGVSFSEAGGIIIDGSPAYSTYSLCKSYPTTLLLSVWMISSYIWRSVNGGLSWNKINISDLKPAGASTFIPEFLTDMGGTEVWAGIYTSGISTGAPILKSVDGGANWTGQTTGHAHVRHILKLSNGNIVYCGEGGPSGTGIHMSTDGGATWPYSHYGVIYPNSPFIDLGGGIVLFCNSAIYSGEASFHKVLRSTDYGASWAYTPDCGLQMQSPSHAISLGSGIALMRCNYGSIYRTTDYGDTWTRVFDNGVSSYNASNFFYFGAGRVIFLGGDSYGRCYVFNSTDYGATWNIWSIDSISYGPSVYFE